MTPYRRLILTPLPWETSAAEPGAVERSGTAQGSAAERAICRSAALVTEYPFLAALPSMQPLNQDKLSVVPVA
jgi:hypothetical protein